MGDMFRMGFPTRNELGLYIDGWIICSPANVKKSAKKPQHGISGRGELPKHLKFSLRRWFFGDDDCCFFFVAGAQYAKTGSSLPFGRKSKDVRQLMGLAGLFGLRSEGFCRGKSFSSGLYCSSSC